MLEDQYGLSHLLQIIKSNDPLMLGQDLAKMGLDFTSKEKYLHKSFRGPWNQGQGQMSSVDLDVPLPEEYRNVAQIRNRLPDLKTAKLHEEVLFYLFYNRPGDVYQIAAASELIKRNWRFHKVLKCWLLTAFPPNFTSMPYEDFGDCLCILFDPIDWKKKTQTIRLKVNELETSLDISSVVSSNDCPPKTTTTPIPHQLGCIVRPNREEKEIGNKADPPGTSMTEAKEAKPQTLLSEDPYSAITRWDQRTIEQLHRIAQGKSIPRSEMRILLNFLRENTEILGRNGFGEQFLNFLQNEPEIAGLVLTFQLMYDLKAYCANWELLLNMELNVQVLEVVNKFVQLCEYKSLPIPEDFLHKFVSFCITSCERFDSSQDLAAHRLVRMVCVFLSSLLSIERFNSLAIRSEIQSFATAYLSLREASLLYQKALGQPSS